MRFQLLILTILLFGCTGGNNLSTDTENNTSDKEVNSEICSTEYAEHFQIENGDSVYILNILDPETKEVEKSFSINPSSNNKVISLTATITGMLSILEQTDILVGVGDRDYIYDLDLIQRVQSGKLEEFGDESSYSLEKVLNSGANTVLYSGFGDKFPNQEKLEKLNIMILPIYDWREQHPLGKAEWIKVAGILCGKEKEALAFYSNVIEQYQENKSLVSGLQINPTVIAGNLWADVWYTPGGNSYMAKMIEEAGGDFVYKGMGRTGSSELTIEQILIDNKNTEIWLNPGLETKHAIIQNNPHAKHLKAIEKTYCYSPNMAKFWERSAAEPHLMLSDLIHIFHPEIKEIDTLHFYKRIR
jgi:iron complex transport system substrate-binding protein